jgi:hypothetical protein
MYGLTIRKNRPVSDDPGDVFWQRQYTDQFGAWFREKAASNPRTFALLQAAGCALTAPGGGIGCALIQGISTGIITKDFKAGLKTSAIAYAYSKAANWIGHGGSADGTVPGIRSDIGRVAAHGAIGGAYSAVNGGSFWKGAISTAVSESAAEFFPPEAGGFRDNYLAGAAEAALIGGTSGVITGGGTEGFVNGARSAAMSRLYNVWGLIIRAAYVGIPTGIRYVGRKITQLAVKNGDDVTKNVDISRAKYGDAAEHIADAQKAGHPDVLTIARDGAAANRKASIGGLPKVPGKQLDEYPPAMFKEGGAGASVRAISPKNNMGVGACIGNACRGLANGEKVRIRVVD